MGQLSTASLSGLLNTTKGKFDLGTAFLPAGKERGVPTGGACLVILTKAPAANKRAAAAFIKYLTNTENAAAFSEASGYMPATYSAVKSERIQKLYAQYPQYEVAYRQLEYANTRPMRKGYREMSVIMQEEFKKAMRDTSISPQAVVESAAQKVQELIDE
jgi:sn-glycerol 3-phosphate transport system substrate-binding protein